MENSYFDCFNSEYVRELERYASKRNEHLEEEVPCIDVDIDMEEMAKGYIEMGRLIYEENLQNGWLINPPKYQYHNKRN